MNPATTTGILLPTMLLLAFSPALADPPRITIWHGKTQRVGHLGVAQNDFNVLGHVSDPDAIVGLTYEINDHFEVPLSFRSYRRLVVDGDFNADVPLGRLTPGRNKIVIRATNRQGETALETVTVVREEGRSPLPFRIRWPSVKNAQDVGQFVDGRWAVEKGGLRTKQTGYDRIFLIGEKTWKDYEVRTDITLHEVTKETSPVSGGNGVGIILRFAGHVTGGPRHFPSGQPKFGYLPLGGIAFLRWDEGKPDQPPQRQFFSGDSNKMANYGRFPVRLKTCYAIRFACKTLPDAPDGAGVTRYSFKIWPTEDEEPKKCDWQHVQTSQTALRTGGVVLLAHHVDVTFGSTTITPVE